MNNTKKQMSLYNEETRVTYANVIYNEVQHNVIDACTFQSPSDTFPHHMSRNPCVFHSACNRHKTMLILVPHLDLRRWRTDTVYWGTMALTSINIHCLFNIYSHTIAPDWNWHQMLSTRWLTCYELLSGDKRPAIALSHVRKLLMVYCYRLGTEGKNLGYLSL